MVSLDYAPACTQPQVTVTEDTWMSCRVPQPSATQGNMYTTMFMIQTPQGVYMHSEKLCENRSGSMKSK